MNILSDGRINLEATASQPAFTIRPPVPEIPAEAVRNSAIAQSMVETWHEWGIGARVMAENATQAARTLGRWAMQHREGVSYGLAGAAAAVGGYIATKGVIDAQLYDSTRETIGMMMGVESTNSVAHKSTTGSILTAATLLTTSLLSTLTGFMFNADKQGR